MLIIEQPLAKSVGMSNINNKDLSNIQINKSIYGDYLLSYKYVNSGEFQENEWQWHNQMG